MMDQHRAMIRFTLYRAEGSMGAGIEADLEIPLSITPEDLKKALSSMYGRPIDVLKTEDPIVLLLGSRTLEEYGIRNGTHIFAREHQAGNGKDITHEVFTDSQNETRKLTRRVDLSGTDQLAIGFSRRGHLIIAGRQTVSDDVMLSRETEGWRLVREKTACGVYRNGRKVLEGEIFGDTDFLWVSDYAFYFRQGAVYTEKRDDLIIHGLGFSDSLLPDPDRY